MADQYDAFQDDAFQDDAFQTAARVGATADWAISRPPRQAAPRPVRIEGLAARGSDRAVGTATAEVLSVVGTARATVGVSAGGRGAEAPRLASVASATVSSQARGVGVEMAPTGVAHLASISAQGSDRSTGTAHAMGRREIQAQNQRVVEELILLGVI